MTQAIDSLAIHGPMLLVGVTGVLAIGAGAVAVRNSPIEKQRLAELSMLSVLVWSILAALPLPRFGSTGSFNLPSNAIVKSADEPIVARLNRGAPHSVPKRINHIPSISRNGGSLAHTPASRGQRAEPTTANWSRALAMGYLVGAALAVCWLTVCGVLLRRVVRRAEPPEPWLLELYASLPTPAGSPAAALRVSPSCRWPFSCGAWRPLVVLPDRLCRPDRADTLRHVLLHELSHVRQHDARGHLLFNLMLPWLYFHPLYWWLRAAARDAREAIADDWAARNSSPDAYAGHLIGLARDLTSSSPLRWAALAVIGSSSQFYRRMTMLLKRRNALATHCSRGWKIVSLTCAALVVVGAAWRLGIEPAAAQVEQSKIMIEQRVSEKTVHHAGEEQAMGDCLVRFAGPDGARVRWRSGAPDKPVDHILQLTMPRGNVGNVRFRQGAVHQLLLSNLPGRDGVVLYPSLETRRSLPASEEFLKHSAIPIQFAEEDFDQALAGNLVTKVIYLPDAELQEAALGGVETLVSTRVEPGIDPVLDAERKGTILAILRMGNAVAPLKVAAAGATAIESPQTTTGVLQAAAAVGVEASGELGAGDSPSRRPARMRLTASQLDLVEWIAAYSDAVRDAEIAIYDLERHVEAEKSTPGVTPASELRRMRAEKKAAERKTSLLLKLLKGAITAAKAEADASKRNLTELNKVGTGVIRAQQLLEARLRFETAQAEVELLQSLMSETTEE